MKVFLYESVLSEQQEYVPVEPVLALGWGSMAGEQPLIKLFQFCSGKIGVTSARLW